MKISSSQRVVDQYPLVIPIPVVALAASFLDENTLISGTKRLDFNTDFVTMSINHIISEGSSHSPRKEAHSVRESTSLSSVDTTLIKDPSCPSASLTEDFPTHGLDVAHQYYRDSLPPFVMKKPHQSLPPRDVYLTRNGQRVDPVVPSKLVTQSWGGSSCFWTLLLDDERRIVKGRPNAGVVRGAKWTYFPWSPGLNDFEDIPIAFSTLNNDPMNVPNYLKRKRKTKTQALTSVNGDLTTPQAAITPGIKSKKMYPSGNSVLSHDLYSSDEDFHPIETLQNAHSTSRLRSNPLPGGWFCLGEDSDMAHVGSQTSQELASMTASASSSSSSGSDTDEESESAEHDPGRPTISFTPINSPSQHSLMTTSQALPEPKWNGENAPMGKKSESDDNHETLVDSHTIQSPSAAAAHDTNSGTAPSRIPTIKSPPKEIEVKEASKSSIGLNSEDPPSGSTVELPLSLSRPRRNIRPTHKRTTSPPIDVTHVPKKHKAKGSTNVSSAKSQKIQTSPTSKHPTTSYATPRPTPKLAKHPSPQLHKTVEDEKFSTASLTAYKQARTTLRVPFNSLSGPSIVPIKLRSCMTIDKFFSTVISAAESTTQEASRSIIRVSFDWKDDKDLKKSICVKKNVEDSFEVFLEIIDEAPCWKGENGRCEVAVDVVAT